MQEEKLHTKETVSAETVGQGKEETAKDPEKDKETAEKKVEALAPEKEEVNDEELVEEKVEEKGEASSSEKEEIEKLKAQLAAQKEEYDALFSRYQRLQADFENYKRRSKKELADMIKFGSERLIVGLLPCLDNFARALGGAPKDGEVGKYMTGMEMIYRQCLDLLKAEGLKEIEAVGQPFDPAKHHAVSQVETDKVEEDNLVVEELQVGYTFHDKVIRPSLVKVAKYVGSNQKE